jgi:hypothetical protein
MAAPELGIALDRVCSIVVRARSSTPRKRWLRKTTAPIQSTRDFARSWRPIPTTELQAAIDDLNLDEQCALVALV